LDVTSSALGKNLDLPLRVLQIHWMICLLNIDKIVVVQ